jgi:flagellin
MTVINTNVKSLQAQNAITFNNRSLSNAMQQLSTGSRINSSKDDAAGLAISDKMTAQIRGLNQSIRNANDGIGLLQTAEGAMVEITNMMQRMRELAIQSANDTNAQDDRNYLDLEFQQLKQEINRITKNTQWNGMNILDQTEPASGARNGVFTFQVGANTGDAHKITHTLDKLAFGDITGASTVGVADLTGPWGEIQTISFTNAVTTAGTLTIDGVAISLTTAADSPVKVATAVETALKANATFMNGRAVTRDGANVIVTFGVAEKDVQTLTPTASGGLVGGASTVVETRKFEPLAVTQSTFTFGSSLAVGNVVTVTANNKQFQYTVTAADVAKTTVGLTPPTIDKVVAESIFAQLGGSISPAKDAEFSGLSVKYTASDNKLIFRGADGQKYESFVKVTDGKLATIDALNVKSQNNSDLAINGLDKAMVKVNEARAEIGAVINRLNYAADNLANVSMNTSESRSRILDTDYAKASAELARTQIISQAATAMLAQANQQPQAVLQLLQG